MADLGAIATGSLALDGPQITPKTFSGTVPDITTPPATVRLYLRSTGALVRDVVTKPDGTFVMAANMDTQSQEHYALALDSADNARIFDHIVPGP